GRMTEAIASYSHAASLSPSNADAQYNLAVAYFEIGNERMALAAAKTLRELDVKLYGKFVSETRLEK
ncbi:MAG: tetratricopeptide repeat protein, partial [Acidobacteriota bacterium]|nr:tetratricopeptide repeat protein [Acidobacteriota bacterium]